MPDRLDAYRESLHSRMEDIEFELMEIHVATWSKSGHVQSLLRELDQVVGALRSVELFLAAEKVLADTSAHGVSGS